MNCEQQQQQQQAGDSDEDKMDEGEAEARKEAELTATFDAGMIDRTLYEREREEAARQAIARCPSCSAPLGDAVAEVGEAEGQAATFVKPLAAAQVEVPPVAAPGRGGRG